MDVQIVGQHLKLSAEAKENIKTKLLHVVHKFFDEVNDAGVHFVKQGKNLFKCDISANVKGRKLKFRGDGKSEDMYDSFSMSLSKLEKQLRRYKSYAKKYHKSHSSEAIKYVIAPFEDENEVLDPSPIIIAEKASEIFTSTVKEAVMKMDMENLPALLFKHIDTGRINLVYYRKDGNISWVDSKE